MAFSLNRVQLIGNLGRDPEVRYTQDGRPIANLNIATSESWNDQQGQRQERTEWHRVVIFGRLAEIAQQYLRKGSKVFVEGQLQTRKWQDQSGQDRYSTEVVVSGFQGNMINLDPRQGGGGGGGGYAEGGGPGDYGPHGGGYAPAGGGGYGGPPGGGGQGRGGQSAGGGGQPAGRGGPPSQSAGGGEDLNQIPAFDDDIPF